MLIFFYLKVKPTSIEIPPVIPNCMVGTRRDINPRQQTPNILIKNTKKKESGVCCGRNNKNEIEIIYG